MRIRIGVKGWDGDRPAGDGEPSAALGPYWFELVDEDGNTFRSERIAGFELSTINEPPDSGDAYIGPKFTITTLQLTGAPELVYDHE